MIGKFENGQSFLLPGGYVDADCELVREVELAPLSGRDEELIAAQQAIASPALLTSLLSRCVLRIGPIRPVSEDLARRLLVADRQFLLLKLRQVTFGDHVQATVQCPWEACRQKVDIDFSLHDIPLRKPEEKGPLYTRELSSEAAFSDEHGEQYREVVFRLPNGEDQEAISQIIEEDEAEAQALLLARCIRRLGPLHDPGPEVVHRMSPLARAEIERHMEESAPHVDLTLAARCPECEREFAVPFDLLGFFLGECKTSRELLYREVHYLAYHYHWSELEILGLSREKRRKYIALLADEMRRVAMPSEQSPQSNARPTRTGSTEKGLHPSSTGGVRGLLGLPMRESGLQPTASLTAPRGHHSGQPPLPASGENDESLREIARDEELIEAGGSAGTDPESDFSGSLPHDVASAPSAIPENPADPRSTPSAMSAEHREQTSFLIPGVSTQRTEFAALSHTSDKTKVTQLEESREPGSEKIAPMRTAVPHPRETAMFDIEFLSRLEHLVTEGARTEHSVEAQHGSVAPRSPNPIEQMGVPNGERGGRDLAQRFEHLQRTVRELAATVSSQAARNREESQPQRRERMTSAPQHVVIIKRSEASSTTPRAFWERSRLGRFHLRTGR